MSFTTAQAAAQIGRTPRTLRKWEQVGLIPPVAQVNGKRAYTDNDIERLREIAKLNSARVRHHQPRHVPVDTPARNLPPGLARHRSSVNHYDSSRAGTPSEPPTILRVSHQGRGPPELGQPGAARSRADTMGRDDWRDGNKKLNDLPTKCGTCWRSLVRHGCIRRPGPKVVGLVRSARGSGRTAMDDVARVPPVRFRTDIRFHRYAGGTPEFQQETICERCGPVEVMKTVEPEASHRVCMRRPSYPRFPSRGP